MFYDNKSTIFIIKSRVNNSKTKHADVDYHYIIDILERGGVKVNYVTSEEMVVHPMIKGLSLERFREYITKMGTVSPKDVEGIGGY